MNEPNLALGEVYAREPLVGARRSREAVLQQSIDVLRVHLAVVRSMASIERVVEVAADVLVDSEVRDE